MGWGVRPGNLPRAREFWRGELSALALVYFPFQVIALGYRFFIAPCMACNRLRASFMASRPDLAAMRSLSLFSSKLSLGPCGGFRPRWGFFFVWAPEVRRP